MDFHELARHLNEEVRLSFKDGEIIDAVLLGVDEQTHRDLTYEVRRVLSVGKPRPEGTTVGATCIASLDELEAWSMQS